MLSNKDLSSLKNQNNSLPPSSLRNQNNSSLNAREEKEEINLNNILTLKLSDEELVKRIKRQNFSNRVIMKFLDQNKYYRKYFDEYFDEYFNEKKQKFIEQNQSPSIEQKQSPSIEQKQLPSYFDDMMMHPIEQKQNNSPPKEKKSNEQKQDNPPPEEKKSNEQKQDNSPPEEKKSNEQKQDNPHQWENRFETSVIEWHNTNLYVNSHNTIVKAMHKDVANPYILESHVKISNSFKKEIFPYRIGLIHNNAFFPQEYTWKTPYDINTKYKYRFNKWASDNDKKSAEELYINLFKRIEYKSAAVDAIFANPLKQFEDICTSINSLKQVENICTSTINNDQNINININAKKIRRAQDDIQNYHTIIDYNLVTLPIKSKNMQFRPELGCVLTWTQGTPKTQTKKLISVSLFHNFDRSTGAYGYNPNYNKYMHSIFESVTSLIYNRPEWYVRIYTDESILDPHNKDNLSWRTLFNRFLKYDHIQVIFIDMPLFSLKNIHFDDNSVRYGHLGLAAVNFRFLTMFDKNVEICCIRDIDNIWTDQDLYFTNVWIETDKDICLYLDPEYAGNEIIGLTATENTHLILGQKKYMTTLAGLWNFKKPLGKQNNFSESIWQCMFRYYLEAYEFVYDQKYKNHRFYKTPFIYRHEEFALARIVMPNLINTYRSVYIYNIGGDQLSIAYEFNRLRNRSTVAVNLLESKLGLTPGFLLYINECAGAYHQIGKFVYAIIQDILFKTIIEPEKDKGKNVFIKKDPNIIDYLRKDESYLRISDLGIDIDTDMHQLLWYNCAEKNKNKNDYRPEGYLCGTDISYQVRTKSDYKIDLYEKLLPYTEIYYKTVLYNGCVPKLHHFGIPIPAASPNISEKYSNIKDKKILLKQNIYDDVQKIFIKQYKHLPISLIHSVLTLDTPFDKYTKMRLVTFAWWLVQDQLAYAPPDVIITHQFLLMVLFGFRGNLKFKSSNISIENFVSDKLTTNKFVPLFIYYNILIELIYYLVVTPNAFKNLTDAYSVRLSGWGIPSIDNACCSMIDEKILDNLLQKVNINDNIRNNIINTTAIADLIPQRFNTVFELFSGVFKYWNIGYTLSSVLDTEWTKLRIYMTDPNIPNIIHNNNNTIRRIINKQFENNIPDQVPHPPWFKTITRLNINDNIKTRLITMAWWIIQPQTNEFKLPDIVRDHQYFIIDLIASDENIINRVNSVPNSNSDIINKIPGAKPYIIYQDILTQIINYIIFSPNGRQKLYSAYLRGYNEDITGYLPSSDILCCGSISKTYLSKFGKKINVCNTNVDKIINRLSELIFKNVPLQELVQQQSITENTTNVVQNEIEVAIGKEYDEFINQTWNKIKKDIKKYITIKNANEKDQNTYKINILV